MAPIVCFRQAKLLCFATVYWEARLDFPVVDMLAAGAPNERQLGILIDLSITLTSKKPYIVLPDSTYMHCTYDATSRIKQSAANLS